MKFTTKPYVAPIIKVPRDKLTPEQKLNEFIKLEQVRDKRFKLREHHYRSIEHEGTLILFNGLARRIGVFTLDISGERTARAIARELFLASKNVNGGFLFDGIVSQTLTDKELELAKISTAKLAAYQPFIICSDCKSEFELESELRKHRCSDKWLIVNFKLLRRQYA